ncbi:MAG: hypothetical protein GX025_10585 [Clostridiales bacterium]|nr:hypothetical protein [Clostridiales bacterium]
MAKYRTKPVTVDAWQFSKRNYQKGLPREFRSPLVRLWSQYGGEVISGEIETLEGIMTISENDYIIKGVENEFYPFKPDIFKKTYELAD